MSIIHLTDIVLRCPSGLDHNLPDESHISLKVLLNNNKSKVIGPLIKGSESFWKLVENLQLPTGVLSFKITPRRLENYEFTPLGSAEFFCDNLIAMSLAQINEVVQPLVAATCDGPAFELCFSSVVIPSDEPPTIVALNEEQIHQVRAVRQSDQHPVVPYEELAHREALATMLHYQVPESRRKEFLQAFPDLLYQQAVTLRDDDPQKQDMLPTVFNLFHSRYAQDKNPLDLDKAIAAVDDVVKITPDGHPRKADMLAQRGAFLLLRIEHQLGNEHIPTTADFEGAISDLERSLTVTPDDGMRKPNRLRNLGIVFRHRCDLTGDINNIDKSISALNDAVHLTPEGYPSKPACLCQLGLSLTSRFEVTRNPVDADEAISAYNDAVQLTPEGHPDKQSYLNNLGSSLMRRFEHTGELIDADEAISACNDAVQLTPEDHPDKQSYLNNLGSSLMRRFEHRGDLIDINRAISAQNHAVCLTPEGDALKPLYLQNLGISYSSCFERTDEVVDIEKAISACKDAVRLTPDGHSDKPERLLGLGTAFMHRSERTGQLADINEAISVYTIAERLIPEDHPDKHSYLNNLGISLRLRFQRTGDLVDIDNAISDHIDSVRLTPDGHALKPGHLHNLGLSFVRRFERTGDIIDIDKAISAHNDAVQLTPMGHAKKPDRLNSLGISFMHRYKHTGELSDIDESVSAHTDAVNLTQDSHPHLCGYQTNLGNSFTQRFTHTGELVDIDKAISAHNDAHTRDLVDVDYAISSYNDAVNLIPDDHTHKTTFLNNLGEALLSRSELTGSRVDIDMAISKFRLCAKSSAGIPSLRYRAATKWARLSLKDNSSTTLDGYDTALALLPRVAWLGQTISDQHKQLLSIGGIGNEAAAAAIALGQQETAIEWLEQARSVVWGQLLNLRTPVDELRDADFELANELERVSKDLESAGNRNDSFIPSDKQLSMEQTARQHRKLATDWDMLIEKARSIPGFEDFLRPKKLEKLSRAARSGPVVVINVHEARCDALVVMADLDDVIHVPLDGFSYTKAEDLQRSLNKVLSTAGVHKRDARGPQMVSTKHDNLKFEEILSMLWTNVVQPVLAALVSIDPEPPRIWWCATGPLTFLPIHAAGLYNTRELGFKTSDFAVSSYTPTLTALLERPVPAQQQFQGLLAVIQPCTPGLSPLPNAEKELAQMEQLDSSLHIHSLSGELATVESVVNGMQECSWVHLACHAIQETSEPTQSAFSLQNRTLTLSKLISQPFPHADFAFLSACQTAKGDKKLSEEAVHLAAGMLAAGYRSVIATMWSIMDEDAPVVACEVYSHLVRDPQLSSTRAAHALHHAVKCLRDQLEESGKSSFTSWVPFIHVGM
ncbi:hypothetical protein PILCRDRAFT_574232 [Piloderma croceum F 1598]|uniref:CHAT domain-containing protein n=1 Tax=Piloderma croceum (strain F 1598) TaxID=765440 RepID=A0A0C3FGB9_PILCF|nr:hypothetical protein PILCRDRAFT_574232 [Piloderma croceum F 1598]